MIKTKVDRERAEEIREALTKQRFEAPTETAARALDAAIEDYTAQIKLYDALVDGAVAFRFAGVGGLGDALVALRIGHGLSQVDLGERLDYSQQQVQKDEHGGYGRASLQKIDEVIEAFDAVLVGFILPRGFVSDEVLANPVVAVAEQEAGAALEATDG